MFVCAVKSEFICCRLKERQRHRVFGTDPVKIDEGRSLLVTLGDAS